MCGSAPRCSARARLSLRMNNDSGTSVEPGQQPPQRCPIERHATRRRSKTGPRQMDKDRAAAPGDSRAPIVVDLDDQVVEMIVTAEPVAWFIGRAAKRLIVTPVGRVLAPGVAHADAPRRQSGDRAHQAVRPPPKAQRAEPAGRRRSITLALVCGNPAAPERDRNGPGSCPHQAARALPGPAVDCQE